MNTEKTTKVIFMLSVLPLLFALFLAIYFRINLADLSAITFKFSRLNSYIYAHSYGAILLSALCGMALGKTLSNKDTGGITLLLFALMISTWVSYKSFADWQGMSFLIFCCIFYTALFVKNKHLLDLPEWFYQSTLKLLISTILLLSLITLVNQ
jgi:hypothetical protein